MALTPQRELQIREELETNPSPQRELALREELDGNAGKPKRQSSQNRTRALIDTVVDQARQRLPLPENLPILGERIQGFGRFVRGLPQGIQRGLVGAVQAGGDINPNLPVSARALFGGAALTDDDLVRAGSDALTDFQNFSDERFRALNPSAEAQAGSVVGEALPAIAATKGVGNIRALSLPGAKGLASRVAAGSGVGGTVGGTSFIPEGEGRLGRTVGGAVFGAALPLGVSAAQGTLNLLRNPANTVLRNTLGRLARKGLQTQVGKRGVAVDKAIGGGKLTLAEKTGDPTLGVFEQTAKSSPGSFGKIIPEINKANKSAIRALFKDLNRVKTGVATPKRVGRSIRVNFDRSVDILTRRRSAQAKIDFGVVDKISKGRTMFVPANNLKAELKSITSEVGISPQKANFLVKMSKDLSKKSSTNLRDILRLRSRLSSAAAGKGSLWKELSDADTKRFAVKAMEAIDKDLTKMGQSLVKQGKPDLGKAVKTAIDNYKKNSKPLNTLEDTALGKLIGKGGQSDDVIAKKVLSQSPGELAVSLDILGKRGGTTVDIIRKNYLRSHVRNAFGGAKDNATQFKFEPRTFNQSITKDKARFNVLFRNPSDRKQVNDAVDAIKRISTQTSGGGVALSPSQLGTEMAGVAVSKNPIFAARTMAKFLPAGIYRKALFTEEGRRALITIAKPLKGQPVTVAAMIKARDALVKIIRENNGN